MSQMTHAIRLAAMSLSLLAAPFLAPEARAQGRPLACQFVASAGLIWERGQWKSTNFRVAEPFVLVLRGGNLEASSVAKPIRSSSPACNVIFEGFVSCNDESGGYLLFNPRTNQGTVGQLLGGTDNDPVKRDTLSVSPFTCQPF